MKGNEDYKNLRKFGDGEKKEKINIQVRKKGGEREGVIRRIG